MPTVIDAFLITVGLDPSNYGKGSAKVRSDFKKTKEEAAQTAKGIEASGKRAGAFFNTLKNEAIGLLAAFTAANGIRDFAAKTIVTDAAMGRLAKNINVAVEEVSAWGGAVRRVGGTSQDAEGALRTLTSAFQDYQLTGTTGHDQDFQALGVTLRDLKDPVTTLMKLADASERMSKPEFVARLQRIGIPEHTINLLERGRRGVSDMLEEQRRLGVVTEEDAAAAEKLQNQLAQISDIFVSVGRAILTEAAPALLGTAVWFQDITREGTALNGILQQIRTANGQTAEAFRDLVASVDPEAWKELNKWLQETAKILGGVVLLNINMVTGALKTVADLIRSITAMLRGDWSSAWQQASKAASDAWRGLTGQAPQGGTPSPAAPVSAAGGAARPAAGGGALTSSAVEAFFMREGYTREQARGIAAGMHAESRLNPNARNPTSGAAGVGQWLGSRKRDFQRMFGHPVEQSTADEQLRFMAWELRNSEGAAGRAIRSQSTAGGALDVYVRQFMRPGAGAETSGDLARGQRLLNGAGTALAGSAAPAGGSSTSSTSIGSITVYTAATDADGIARDLQGALRKRNLTTQANSGLN